MLILVCMVGGGWAGHIVAQLTAPEYQGSIVVLVGEETSPTKLRMHDIQASDSLTAMYGGLIRSRPVLEPVTDQLNLGWSWESLKDHVHVDIGQNNPLIYITAFANSAAKATTIATAVAKQTVALGPEPPLNGEQSAGFLAGQIAALEKSITQGDKEILRPRSAIGSSDVAELQSRIELISALQRNYTAFAHLLSLAGSPNSLHILGEATSEARIRPYTKIETAIGAGVGLLAGAGLVEALLLGRRRRVTTAPEGPTSSDTEWYADQMGSTSSVVTAPRLDPWISELAHRAPDEDQLTGVGAP